MAAWYLFLIKKILLEYSPLGGCCVYPVPGQVLLCVEIHLWAAFSEARRTDEPASEPWACMHVVPIIASSTHSPLGTFWGQRRGTRNRPSPAGPLPFPFSRGRVSRVKQAGPRGFQKPDRGGTRCARASDVRRWARAEARDHFQVPNSRSSLPTTKGGCSLTLTLPRSSQGLDSGRWSL